MKIQMVLATAWLSLATIYAQEIRVTVPRNQCETAAGSRRATDALQTLRGLPAGMPGRDDAISACDAKVQGLKKQEDDKWARAAQFRNGGQCAAAQQLFEELARPGTAYQKEAGDQLHSLNCAAPNNAAVNSSATLNTCADAPLNLRNAQGAFRVANFNQAKQLAAAAQSCPATSEEAKKLLDDIQRTEKNRSLSEQARLRLLRKDSESACKLILQIDPNFPDFKDLKRQAGDCPSPEERVQVPVVAPDPLLPDYNRAVGLVRTKPAEAERALQKIYAADRNYKDVAELLRTLRSDLETKDFNELERQARNFLEAGDLQAALGKIDRAIALKPTEFRLRDFRQLLTDRLDKENRVLSSAIDAYYAGKYSEAKNALAAFANDPHSPRILALARFYAGASAASEYYLGGQSDAGKRDEARNAFSYALKNAPQFSPDLTKLSPKVRSLYLELTSNQGKK